MQSVNLSASSFYVPSNESTNYLNYGAAVSEVSWFCFCFLCTAQIKMVYSQVHQLLHLLNVNCSMLCHIFTRALLLK